MDKLTLTWLGQSGFLLDTPEGRIACDLYLSDYCQKISKLDHTRMAEIPVEPEALDNISSYLITHEHIDHFDPETVGPILQFGKQTQFYCPPVCKTIIDKHFPVEANRFTLLKGMTEYNISPNVKLVPVPAAHEELEIDKTSGEYVAFSYLLVFEELSTAVFFGGDTIPYLEQQEHIKKFLPAGFRLILVLPVNGRDKERAELGFKGNLTLNEAVELYHQLNADLFVPCHFGMFALNDIKETMNHNVFQEKGCNAVIPSILKEIVI